MITIGLHSRMAGLLGLVVIMLATSLFGQQYGQIVGKIVEAETNMELPGANILVEGTSLGAASDIQGKYIIARVPVGTQTIRVSYLGYKEVTATVTVDAGQSIEQNFNLVQASVAGEEVVVWGERAKGQALALNQQKNAPNIKNIVASDQMGRFPDPSVPEAVKRIPGISVQRDMGEGRYIQIRGGSPRMTSVTFNGERVPSPEGDNRQIALDAVPVDVLESVEVSKAITPDMDADAIGGSVNLITKRAPDQQLLQVEAAGGYAPIREIPSANGSFTYGNRFSDGKLGLLVSGSANRRNFGADDVEPDYEFEEPGLSDDQLAELQVRHYTLWRARIGGTGMLDYQFNKNSYLYLNGVYTELQDNEQRRRLIQNVEDGELEYNHKSRLEKLRSMNVTAGGEHLFGSGYQLDYHVTMTQSEEETPHDQEIIFLQEDVTFDPDISDPDNIQANPDPEFINGDFLFDGFEPASSNTKDTDYIGALNLSIPYQLANTVGKLKVGFKYRQKTKTQDVVENEYGLIDGADNILLASTGDDDFKFSNFAPGDYPFPSTVTSEDYVNDFLDNHGSSLEGETVIDADVEDFNAEENTLALYAMTEIYFTPKFMLLPGLRYEQTDVVASGKEYDSETELITPTTAEKSYGKMFPMVHARYRFTPQTNLRAAITSVLARPNYFDMTPYRLRDDEDIELGNPNLNPTFAYNYDLMFEHYVQDIGVLSAGVFYKQIDDPIFYFMWDNELGGETVQPQNGQSGSIAGLELAYQRQLRFLPAPFDGLGVYGNYTYTTANATLPDGREVKFAGQPDNVYNLALSYEKGGFSGQISLNYNDKYVLEYGEDAASDLFVQPHLQLDITASYRILQNLSMFAELVNLTNEPYRTYLGVEDRPFQIEYYRQWGRIGIRYSM